jgi:hypothetical protein
VQKPVGFKFHWALPGGLISRLTSMHSRNGVLEARPRLLDRRALPRECLLIIITGERYMQLLFDAKLFGPGDHREERNDEQKEKPKPKKADASQF